MVSASATSRRAARRSWLGLVRDARGAAAVEFALLSVPFTLLLCAILEAGLVLLQQQSLSAAVDRAGRPLSTGAFQSGADGSAPAERFAALLCRQYAFDCSRLKVEVTASPTVASQSVSQPYDAANRTMTEGFGTRFQCPAGDQLVIVRAAAPIPQVFSFLDFSGRKLATGERLIIATAVFRSEPFSKRNC